MIRCHLGEFHIHAMLDINGVPFLQELWQQQKLYMLFYSHSDLWVSERIQTSTCVFVLTEQSTTRRVKERQRPARFGGWSLSGSGEIRPEHSHGVNKIINVNNKKKKKPWHGFLSEIHSRAVSSEFTSCRTETMSALCTNVTANTFWVKYKHLPPVSTVATN